MRGVKVPATILSNAARLFLLAIKGNSVLLLDEWPMCAAMPSLQRCFDLFAACVTHLCPDMWAFVLLHSLVPRSGRSLETTCLSSGCWSCSTSCSG